MSKSNNARGPFTPAWGATVSALNPDHAVVMIPMTHAEYQRAGDCWQACGDLDPQLLQSAFKAVERQRDILLAAVQRTVIENRHLADGEQCTLRPLTRALEQIGMQP